MLDDHIQVVEDAPRPALPLALAADAGRLGLAHPQLDLVDNGPDLPVVGRGADHERVGDGKLIAHVIGDNAVGELVRGG